MAVMPIVIRTPRTIPIGIRRQINQRNIDSRRYSIIKISHDTEQSPGVFRRLPVTQTPVEADQLTVV